LVSALATVSPGRRDDMFLAGKKIIDQGAQRDWQI